MPTIPNRTRYASFGVAATIFEAADASKTYVRMPTSNATIEPRTTGTWYVGVCESSRHDWPNPAPDFVRVASMVLSPPGSRPRCQGIWVLGRFSNRGIVPIRMMWLGLSRKLLLSPGTTILFPPESASLSKNGEHWQRHVSLPMTEDPPSVGGGSQVALRSGPGRGAEATRFLSRRCLRWDSDSAFRRRPPGPPNLPRRRPCRSHVAS